MMVPVAILAVLAVIGGFAMAPTSTFLEAVVGKMRWEENFAAIAAGVVTMLLGAALFVGALRIKPWSAYVPWAQRVLERKYYFDEVYDWAFVRPMDWVAGFALRDVEEPVIDAAVVDTGRIAGWTAREGALLETGYFRNYVLVFVVGAVAIAGILLALRALS
jgi:NADH-quinone oxidoreductase subunit L